MFPMVDSNSPMNKGSSPINKGRKSSLDKKL